MGIFNRETGIRPFYFAFLSSTFGDAFRILAVNVWIFTATEGSVSDRLLLVLLGNLPGILLGGVAGVLSDRLNRFKTLIISDLLRLLISLGLMVCAITSSPYHALALIAVGNAVGVFFATSSFAMIPSIVAKENIPRVNGIMETTQWVLQIVGPSAAAGIIVWLGSPAAFFIDAVSFALSSLFLLAFYGSHKAQLVESPNSQTETSEAERTSVSADFWEGIAYIIKNSELLSLLLASYGITFLTATTQFTLIFLISESLDQRPETLGYLFSLNGLVGVIAATLCTTLLSQANLSRVLVLSMLGLCAAQIIMGSAGTIAVLAIGVVMSALSNAPYNVAITSLYMSSIKTKYLGRVEGIDTVIDNSVTILAFLVCFYVVDTHGPRWMFFISAAIALPCAILAACKVRSVKQ